MNLIWVGTVPYKITIVLVNLDIHRVSSLKMIFWLKLWFSSKRSKYHLENKWHCPWSLTYSSWVIWIGFRLKFRRKFAKMESAKGRIRGIDCSTFSSCTFSYTAAMFLTDRAFLWRMGVGWRVDFEPSTSIAVKWAHKCNVCTNKQNNKQQFKLMSLKQHRPTSIEKLFTSAIEFSCKTSKSIKWCLRNEYFK